MTKQTSTVQIVAATGPAFVTRSGRAVYDGVYKPMEGSHLPGTCDTSDGALARRWRQRLREEEKSTNFEK